MKLLRVTDFIRDEVGDVAQTTTGRFVRNRRKKALHWYPSGRGKEPVEFYQLASSLHEYLIYGSLGIYKGRLGTPCDDL